MNKYQFLEDREKNPVILYYGQLGPCQLLCHKQTKQLSVLKLTLKIEAIKDIECLTQMNHPNIIKVLNHFNHEDNTLIVFQLLTGGDLFTKIKHKDLKQSQIAPIFRGICSGIQYIHSRKIIHRNLKSQTILLDHHLNPKIVDFGLAARIGTRRTFCGCYYYMAPEILKNQQYNQKADVWALGVILYEMVYGDVPFKGENSQEVLNQIKNSKIFSKNYQIDSFDQLIRRMLCQNYHKRPSITQILQYQILSVQPLNFLEIGYKSQQKIQNGDSKYKISKKTYNRSLQVTKSHRIKQSKHQFNKQSNASFCQRFQRAFSNKIKAIKDSQKIQQSPAYNYVE